MDRADLIAALEKAERPSEELDVQIVAFLHNAIVKRYPPTDDFGPKNRWQFWSRDGAHFLGSEYKFKVLNYTASLDAALSLVPKGLGYQLDNFSHQKWCGLTEDHQNAEGTGHTGPKVSAAIAKTLPTAICIAALRAKET